MSKKVIFKGELRNVVFSSDSFKIYGMIVDKSQYGFVKLSKYKTCCIVGDLPDLEKDVAYTIVATEKQTPNYGYQYQVLKISREKPISAEDTYKFLSEVITERQTNILLDAYPDIVERILNDEEVDLEKTKGIKEATFEVIKDKVIRDFKLMDLIAEYSEYGLTLTMIRKLYNKYTSIEKVKQKMEENPYECLCNLNRVGFLSADKMILGIKPQLEDSLQRCGACMDYLLEQNESEGNTYMTRTSLFNKVYDMVGEKGARHFDDALIFGLDVRVANGKIARKYTYDCEVYIADKLNKLIEESKVLDVDISKYGEVGGFALTDEQMKTLDNFCKYNISVLVGAGGCGKSASIEALVQLMEDNKIKYALCTPTGVSAEVLSAYVNREASTIHRLLGFGSGEPMGEEVKLEIDALIVDETTMADIFIIKALLSAIDTSRTRVLFVGDPFQLTSVSCGNVFYDVIKSGIVPISELTKVFRYSDGGMARVITDVRHGKMFTKDDFNGFKHFGTEKDYTLIKVAKEQMLEYTCNIYKEFLTRGEDIQNITIVTAMNKSDFGTVNVNNLIQSVINPPSSSKNELKYKNTTFRVDDKVMATKNNYSVTTQDGDVEAIYNGNQGIVYRINKKELTVKFNSGKLIVYKGDELDNLTLSYAVSIHKMQGNSTKNIIYLCPSSHVYMSTRNLMYTALSRSRKKIFHLVENLRIFHTSLGKIESEQRDTFLKDFLQENNLQKSLTLIK